MYTINIYTYLALIYFVCLSFIRFCCFFFFFHCFLISNANPISILYKCIRTHMYLYVFVHFIVKLDLLFYIRNAHFLILTGNGCFFFLNLYINIKGLYNICLHRRLYQGDLFFNLFKHINLYKIF